MNMLGQVSSLQRATLLLESQPRALPGDGAAAVSNVCEQLVGGHVVLVVPQLIEVGHAVGEKRRQRASKSVTLAASSLQTALAAADDGLGAVGDVVDGALLDDRHATERVCQFGAEFFFRLGVDVDVLALGQTAEFDYVGCEDAVLVAVDKVWTGLCQVKTVGVKHKGNALLPGLGEDASAGLLHDGIATETRADNNDVEAVQHGDHVLGDCVDGLVFAHVLFLAHVGVHHQVGRVGLDDCAGTGLADDVRLVIV